MDERTPDPSEWKYRLIEGGFSFTVKDFYQADCCLVACAKLFKGCDLQILIYVKVLGNRPWARFKT